LPPGAPSPSFLPLGLAPRGAFAASVGVGAAAGAGTGVVEAGPAGAGVGVGVVEACVVPSGDRFCSGAGVGVWSAIQRQY